MRSARAVDGVVELAQPEVADELAALVKSLQEELGRSNENVLSLKIVSQADKIEKLAKRIKEAAKGY